MSSSMHDAEERFHGGQLLESRKDTGNFLQVWPVFASHIHGKELCLGWHQLLLKVHGVGKYFSPVHIKGFKKETMATHSNLHALFIQFGCPSWCLPCCCPLGVPTRASSLCLWHVNKNKSNKINGIIKHYICHVFTKFDFLVGRQKLQLGRKSMLDRYVYFSNRSILSNYDSNLPFSQLSGSCPQIQTLHCLQPQINLQKRHGHQNCGRQIEMKCIKYVTKSINQSINNNTGTKSTFHFGESDITFCFHLLKQPTFLVCRLGRWEQHHSRVGPSQTKHMKTPRSCAAGCRLWYVQTGRYIE